MKRLVYLIFPLALVSCEKEIPLNAEVTDPKLVLNCGFEEGEPWEVHVSQSLSVIDNGNLSGVDGATVNILDNNGTLLETLNDDGNGYYSSTSLVGASGTGYKLTVSKSGFTSIESSDIVPSIPVINYKDTVSGTYLGEDVFEITFDINDPAGSNDHYLIQAIGYEDDGFGNTNEYQLWFNVNAPEFENTSPEEYNQIAFLKDGQFNGSNYEITIRADGWVAESNLDSISVYVSSCTEAAYNYAWSYDRYQSTSGDPFSQPVQVYSNVTNGFGIFAGYSTRSFAVEF